VTSFFQHAFTLLFKYPPQVFARGRLIVLPTLPVAVIACGLAIAAGCAMFAVARLRGTSAADRTVLAMIRFGVFVVLAACLLRPALALTAAVPQRNVLALMLDDSRSMQIRDADTVSRIAAVRRAFGDSSALMRALRQRFAVRVFRFSNDATPIAGVTPLTASGTRTDLAMSLASVQQALADAPVAGIIAVSDGADNGGGDIAGTLRALQARGIPVYTVGVGSEQFAHDVSVDQLDVPRTVLHGSGALVTVTLGMHGVAGDSTTLTAEADGHIVARVAVRLPADRDLLDVPIRVPPLAAGLHVVTVRVAGVPGELVTDNNASQSLLRVRGGYERVLYFEGEPRPEFSFLRRAFDEDSAVRLVGLLRSAPGKFLRLDVADSLDLLGGFPTRPEELFRYRALILGDVEAAFFSGAQLRMIGDFVSRRGGALIALGGRTALGEGDYAGTPVAQVLPFTLASAGHRTDDTNVVTLHVMPTAAGVRHPALQLGGSLVQDTARWDSLPNVTTVNQLGDLRPGAVTLLAGRPLPSGPSRPVLAMQHYGRGVAAVLGVQDTWLWKMNPATPVDDHTYETLWRQWVRWSLDQVPDRIEAVAVPERAGPGESIALRAHVVDSLFEDVNDARVSATVVTPTGRTDIVPLDWTLHNDGTYAAPYAITDSGTYQFTVMAVHDGDTTRSAPAGALGDAQGADMQHAELRASLLQQIATATGGRYYAIEHTTQLPDDVMLTHSGIVTHEVRDLWNMPAVLLLLLTLLGCDWGFRRWRGLA
jgi:uncharacterized membrane protein